MALPLQNFVSLAVSAPRGTAGDLTSWSEMAVCDRLIGFYSDLFSDADRARQAARLHWTCWRAYINKLNVQGRASRQTLIRLIKDSQLDASLIERADDLVVDEMSDLVLHRYRRAPLQAKDYVTCMIAAAAAMSAGR